MKDAQKEQEEGKGRPSKLPISAVLSSSLLKVSMEGLHTNTPELKQSGQPTSGAAAKSAVPSNSTSMFCRICKKR